MKSFQYLIPTTINETSFSIDLTDELRKTYNIHFISSTLTENMWTFVATEMEPFEGPLESQALALIVKPESVGTEALFEFNAEGMKIEISAILYKDGSKSVFVELSEL